MNNLWKMFIGSFLFFWAMLAWQHSRYQEKPSRITLHYRKERDQLLNQHAVNMKRLEDEYSSKIFKKSGDTVFDRVYNQPNQSILDLIQNIAIESYPINWTIQTKAEEFTEFALFIQIRKPMKKWEHQKLVAYSKPLVKYTTPALSCIAFFNRNRKCFFFLNDEMLNVIYRKGELNSDQMLEARKQGEVFTRFNSISLEGEFINGHLYIPMSISGPTGEEIVMGMLDTGATTTVISPDVISITGSDNLTYSAKQTFQTANGSIRAPIVKRTIRIGTFEKQIDTAVATQTGMNLLGLNFLSDYHYLIESETATIHIWPKE